MALSGKKAIARQQNRKQQQQQQQQQQQPKQQPKQQQPKQQPQKHSQRWLQGAVVRALVALKARGGASLTLVQRYLQNNFCDVSAKRVQGALGKVACRVPAGLWKLVRNTRVLTEQGQPVAASPPVSPVSDMVPHPRTPNDAQSQQKVEPEKEDCLLNEAERDGRDQYARLKAFIRKSEQLGTGHELRRAHFISARTLHGPISLNLSFLTSRRSMEFDWNVHEDEMRGSIMVTLGAPEPTPITGTVSMMQTGGTEAVAGQLHTNGGATLRLGNLDLQTNDFATAAFSCLRRGGGYVDLMGSDVTSSKSSLVRAYFMLACAAV